MLNVKSTWLRLKADLKYKAQGRNVLLSSDNVPEGFSPKMDGSKLNMNDDIKEVKPAHYVYDEAGVPTGRTK